MEELSGVPLDERTKRYLVADSGRTDKPAGRFHVAQGRYVFGAIHVPKVDKQKDRVIYHEVDVILTASSFVTMRKRHPAAAGPFDPEILLSCCPDKRGRSSGEMFYRLMEDVAEAYEKLIEGLQDEIDELEGAIGLASDDRLHRRYSDLRRDLVTARRNIAPLVRAMRAIEDERLDIRDAVFPTDIEILIRDVRESLERVEEGIPLVADLLSGVRDFHQSYMAQRQNDIVQKLTVIASLLLVPTLIVGIYGQNFDRIPETHWRWGYGWSWLLIVATTLIQLLFFWNAGWIGRKRSTPEVGEDLGSVLITDAETDRHPTDGTRSE